MIVLITVALTLVAGTTILLTRGRSRPDRHRIDPRAFGVQPGTAGTVLLIGTEYCRDCAATARLVTQALTENPASIALGTVDAAKHPAEIRRLDVWQAPTTFVIDADGATRARIAGRPQLAQLRAALEGLAA